MRPLISIILPTYNGREEWIRESIESVLNQTYSDFELIIINDASTNDVERVIKEYEKKDRRIVYLKNEKNLKLVKTLNRGIEQSKGKYIARIDDDDIWNDLKKLEKQVDFMEKNKDYGLCGCSRIIKINEFGEIIGEFSHKSTDKEIRDNMLRWCLFVHSSVIIRKSVLDNVGYYNPSFNKAEDYELWCRIGTVSKLKNISDSYISYRINPSGISKKNRFYQKKLSCKICLKYKKYYPHFFYGFFCRIAEIIFPQKFLISVGKFFRKIKMIN